MPRKLVFEVTIIDNTSDDDPTKFGYCDDQQEADDMQSSIYNSWGCPNESTGTIAVKLLSREKLDADRDESKVS